MTDLLRALAPTALGLLLAALYVAWLTRHDRKPSPPPFDPRKVAVRRREPVTAGAVVNDDAWMDEVNAILGDFS